MDPYLPNASAQESPYVAGKVFLLLFLSNSIHAGHPSADMAGSMCDSEAKKARAEAHKAQGNEEYKKGDYAAAVVHYSRAIGTVIFQFYKWAF
jgi:hypothetical protein